MTKVEYVLTSQGIEIHRTTDKDEAIKIMREANEEWDKHRFECMENNEPYADNEVFLFKERDGEVIYQIER